MSVPFAKYNMEHRHSGIGWLTPETVHYGLAEETITARQHVLDEAYERHQERFARKAPQALELPETLWINPSVSTSG